MPSASRRSGGWAIDSREPRRPLLSRLSVRVFLITFLTLFLVLVGMYAAMEVALYLQVRWWPVRRNSASRTGHQRTCR